MKQAKRIVALLLALVMVAGMLPTVFAEGNQNCLVTINYVFENGETAAASWTASLAQGSEYTNTVDHPTVQGYAVDVDKSTVNPETTGVEISADGTAIDLTNIQGDITITVTYVPALVDYTVNHYWQNAEDDQYTLHESDTLQGLTGSPVGGGLENAYPGFYALLYDEEVAIAADGSTVVEIYYDRNYYLMTFNLGGGYGVEPVYARYGAAIGEIGTPTRPGYTFLGWTPETIPETMPAENTSYTAQWQAPESAKVTLVFWGENANDEDYSYLTSRETVGIPGQEMTYTAGVPQDVLICGKEEHTHTEACIRCTHTHTLDCYSVGGGDDYQLQAEQPSQLETPSADGIYTYTTDSWGRQEIHYYLYLGGTWYCAFERKGFIITWWEKADTREISLECNHTHDPSCYVCGQEAHIHDQSCYMNDDLWTFDRSDTVTVAADGTSILNVYFDRTAFTLTFREAGYRDSELGTITAKWGANIVQAFQDISNEHTFLWSTTRDGDSPWTSYLSAMPAENRTYYASTEGSSSSSRVSAKYIGQDLNGAYTVNLFTTNFRFGDGLKVSEEEFVDIEGFTVNRGMSTPIDEAYDGAKFYYDRNSYTLRFYNYDGELTDAAKTLKYEESFQGDDFIPEYPANLEPNAYRFEGWYDAPFFTEDSWVDFDTETMPANNVMLYANWVPVNHTVNVYLDSTLVTQIGAPQTVAHGAFATAPTEFDEGQYVDYTFVGWFYMDGGVEKAFSFESMPVRQDLDIYAKWSSNVLVEYTVNFVLEGSDTPIADPITGSALAGTTRTFDAKGGADLYLDYQAGYFPTVQSHSMIMDVDGGNTFTFTYVQKESVPYTVYYRDAETGEDLEEPKEVPENTLAVVTEYAVTIKGYLPDAYQKRLVVVADPTDEIRNEIIFYYTKDENHALVVTQHMLMRNGETQQYSIAQETGNIGDTYTRAPLDPAPSGYVLDRITVNGLEWAEEGNPSGTLTGEGLHFTFYYRYNQFDVYYQSAGRTVTYDVVENFSVTDKVNDGYLYGGLYTDDTFTTPLTKETICGLGFKPVPDETYYVKEVPEAYLQPKIYYVYSTYYGNALRRLYLVTALDDMNYQQVGFIVNSTDNREQAVNDTNVYETVTEVRAEGQQSRTLGLSYFFNNTLETGYLNIQQYLDYSVDDMAGKTFTMQPYFVTMDGVKVTGVTLRTVDTGNGTYIPTGGTEGLHVSDAPVGSGVSVYSQPSNQMLNLMSTYTVSWDEAPAATQYTVTKVDGGSTVTQTVEPGDQTGQITYAGQSGKVFAGWFTDSACTLPADFSNVQGDMTVYAKYVDAPSTGVSVQSKRGGATTLKTTVTLDTDQFAQVGFAYDCNGDTGTAVAGEKTEKRSLMGWFFGQGNTTYQYSGSWSTGNLGFMDSFTITPYWVTLDGTTVYGEAESYLSLGALILRK